MTTSLAGLVVAVTGGAQGIGREIAGQLAAAGAKVAIGDYDGQHARNTAQELPGTVHAFDLDVADFASFEKFIADAESQCGALDVLINNAGVMWVGRFDEEPESATARMIAVNLKGVIHGVRGAAPLMRARGKGLIVTVASAAAKVAPPGESTYAATKHGVLGYLTAVREELRGSGVEISVIMPGVVDTELAVGTSTGAAKRLQPAEVAAAVVRTIERPRFQVHLPAYIGPLSAVFALLPQALRDRLVRRLVPNQIDAVQGSTARSNYESRLTKDDQPGETR